VGDYGRDWTAGEVQALRSATLEMLNEIVVNHEAHMVSEPDCPARPMCIGGPSLQAIVDMTRMQPDLPFTLIIVTVQELSEARRKLTETQQRLEIQRDISVSLAQENEAVGKEILELREEVERLKSQQG
jgi:hypothetical protein